MTPAFVYIGIGLGHGLQVFPRLPCKSALLQKVFDLVGEIDLPLRVAHRVWLQVTRGLPQGRSDMLAAPPPDSLAHRHNLMMPRKLVKP